ncbi:MAG: hypothetical protein COT18_02500 [Elusimicrobia bacterium CG08_land_8_20_14_0_20_59_10]|nr:MAG: hypothetical protein COT18_02500 [Elusimicrobia bacterium CG08_land_8_20_14_0_20_59_10]
MGRRTREKQKVKAAASRYIRFKAALDIMDPAFAKQQVPVVKSAARNYTAISGGAGKQAPREGEVALFSHL